MSDESWEARMAARAKGREDQRLAEAEAAENQQVRDAYRDAAQRPWLNGWERVSPTRVQVANTLVCVCCGQVFGTFTIAIPSDWNPPDEPVWPFTAADCPLCLGTT